MGWVELRSHNVQSVPGDHRNSTEDAGQTQTLSFGLNHVDEEDAQTGQDQAASWTAQQRERGVTKNAPDAIE